MSSPISHPLPAQPLLRRDAALLCHGSGDVRIALSARQVVTVVGAPARLPEWLESLDGLHSLEQVVAGAPVDPPQARRILTELDRAGMLADADHGMPFRAAGDVQHDALLLADRRRAGRRGQRTVAVAGSRRWRSPVCAALRLPGVSVEPGNGDGADLLVIVTDAFDTSGESTAAGAMARGLPHVCAVISAVDAVLLPLTLPGRTACWRCWQLQRDSRTPDWAAWAFRGQRPDEPRLPQHHRALVLGLLVEHTLNALDRLDATATERYLDLRKGTVRLRSIEPYPACGCIRLAA